MAKIVTGSVAEIRAPNLNVSINVMILDKGANIKVTPYMIPATAKVDKIVPIKANVKMDPMFRNMLNDDDHNDES